MNKDELGRLFLEKEKSMWNIAYNMLQNKSDIEDAIGNTIVKAFAGLDVSIGLK
jgi:DNA-directed RNA polymerase specialized sigma24 family protein